jgi:flagellar hook-associated protein 2
MSTSAESLIRFEGLASGLHTQEIISAMMAVERQSITRMSDERTVLETQEGALRNLRSDLQSLLTATTTELGSATIFAKSQQVSSSEPARVGATLTASAPAGGYSVAVGSLASAAQRSFTYHSPSAETAVTIEGHELKVKAGETLTQLSEAINADSELPLLATAVGSSTLVLSERETGKQTGSYIAVTGGETLSEITGSAKEGTNALYSINGVEGSSRSNVLKEAIPGVTLTLSALTGATPVSVTISAPEVDKAKVTEAVKSFIASYNSALSALQNELQTKPPTGLAAQAQERKGTLFGDPELRSLVTTMRQETYTAVSTLPAEMSSLTDIGITSGAPSGSSTPAQSAIEGKLQLEESKLTEALAREPEAVAKLLKEWSARFGSAIEASTSLTGNLSSRATSDEERALAISERSTALTEMLGVRQHNLEARFVALETTLSRLKVQSSYVSAELSKLSSSGATAIL